MDRKREVVSRVRGGNMGCIEELLKRKREEDEVKIFDKCKKTPRSPEREKEEGMGREKREKKDKSWFEGWRGVERMMIEMMEEMRSWREQMMTRMKKKTEGEKGGNEEDD